MQKPFRKPLVKRFRLNAKMRSIADASADPLIRSAQKALEEFEYSGVVGTRYSWKYLPDEAFRTVYLKDDVDIYTVNRATLSHLVRVAESFEVTSIWRAWELLEPCVTCLNDEQLSAAATLSRSLIELTLSYGHAANLLREHFKNYPWSKMHDTIIGLDQRGNDGKSIGLESFIERLMGGTRLKEWVQANPDMEQKNILSIMDKTDKLFKKHGQGYTVKPHYEFLCELAHPNTIGYQRFVTSIRDIGNGWTDRVMETKATSERSIHISQECIWAISFSAGSMNGLWGQFQSLKKDLITHLGRPLPI